MNVPAKQKTPLSVIIATIPESPGCYLYLDENGTIIYIGKAKNLKKRVLSYFNKTQDLPKTRILVKKIRDIKYIVVGSESDALLLENNLIKEHQPRYNIMLKDDKSYPWIVVRNEPFPRIYATRKMVKDGSAYYGPYSSVVTMKLMLQLIMRLYPVRTCHYYLNDETIRKGKIKVCLEYHIKNCLGPCEGFQSEADYDRNILAIRELLKGNINHVSKLLYDEMMRLSAELRFEEAQKYKEKYHLLENYRSKSIVANPSTHDMDVFSFESNEQSRYINYLHVVSGMIVQGYTIEYKTRMNEPDEEIFGLGIVELRTRFGSTATEVIVPFLPDAEIPDVEFVIPKRGDKKKLLELSEKNARQYKMDQIKQAEKLYPENRGQRILKTLQKDLHLKELPVHIECFDNSNIQGTNPVSACVVFKDGKPSTKDYRHFNIKTVEGPDDFMSMYETVFRRYKRLSEETGAFPQLVVIDGGKGQLHAATDALKALGLYGTISIIGIAKRLEEIYFPHDSIPLYLDKNSESLKLIQQLRDEAHRFGITFHRNKRSKTQLVSELDSVKGIGPVAKEKLLRHYKSVKKIKEAPLAEIAELIGKAKARALVAGLFGEEATDN
ncbi:MAG: excinuclease ABC subunit UvrC [Dysgonamonadaceae bacterium]|jgi:excinuclease ABC subunit C|nr:excinuclease ABC subunit UvrC [Dysgonamonadaceae bacterium]